MENVGKPVAGMSGRGAGRGLPHGSGARIIQRGALHSGDRCPASPRSFMVTQVGAEDRRDLRCPWGLCCGHRGLQQFWRLAGSAARLPQADQAHQLLTLRQEKACGGTGFSTQQVGPPPTPTLSRPYLRSSR